MGAASFFLGWFDRKHAKTVNKDEIIVSRRAMTKPKGVMLLALINSICILVIMTLLEYKHDRPMFTLLHTLAWFCFFILLIIIWV